MKKQLHSSETHWDYDCQEHINSLPFLVIPRVRQVPNRDLMRSNANQVEIEKAFWDMEVCSSQVMGSNAEVLCKHGTIQFNRRKIEKESILGHRDWCVPYNM